ncbi:MAG: PH domain-containing protein [bacterium]
MEVKSKKYPIPSKLPGEKVIYFIHRHWFIFLKLGLLLLFMSILPFILYLIIKIQIPQVWEYFAGPLTLILGSYLLLVVTFGLIFWMNYYFDIVIITNRRIVEIEQRDLFNRAVFSVEIIHVEDVSVEVNGMFATFFGYGDLEIQTAGASRNFIFHQIPEPNTVAREISTLYNLLVRLNGYKKNNYSKNNKFYPQDDEILETKNIQKSKDHSKHYDLQNQTNQDNNQTSSD